MLKADASRILKENSMLLSEKAEKRGFMLVPSKTTMDFVE